MPRGKRKPALETVNERITQIDSDVEIHKKKITALQAEKKTLQERKKQLELESLYSKIQESGKSVDEIMAAVTQK